jgi:hypothetical protein
MVFFVLCIFLVVLLCSWLKNEEDFLCRFVEAGLMKREYDRVKFHVTLMNTLFRYRTFL